MQYPCRIIHLLKIYKWISMSLCYIHEKLMSIRVFLSEWIFRHEYRHGHCMDTLTRASCRQKLFAAYFMVGICFPS